MYLNNLIDKRNKSLYVRVFLYVTVVGCWQQVCNSYSSKQQQLYVVKVVVQLFFVCDINKIVTERNFNLDFNTIKMYQFQNNLPNIKVNNKKS